MHTRDTYIAVALLGAVVLAWTGTVLFAMNVAGAKTERAAALQDAQQSFALESSSVRTHATAQDTVAERAKLEELLAVDIVSAAAMLKAAGKTTRVEIKLSGALPETAPATPQKGPQIQAVGYALQADGSFAALLRTERLLETLPLASSVQRFDIQRTQTSSGATIWHMNVYIRVLTTSNISS